MAKATGAQMVLTLADMDGNETFDASALGTAEEVCVLSLFLLYQNVTVRVTIWPTAQQ